MSLTVRCRVRSNGACGDRWGEQGGRELLVRRDGGSPRTPSQVSPLGRSDRAESVGSETSTGGLLERGEG